MRTHRPHSPPTGPESRAPSNAAPPSIAVTADVRRAVLILAVPVLGEQILNSLVGIFDVYLAGRISVDATAAIGLAAYVAWLVSMIFMLVGTGTTALVARFTGSAHQRDANHFANQSFGLAVVMGLASTALIYFLAPTFASLQNMTGDRYLITVRYLRIEATAHLFTSLTLVGAAALRGVGDMRTPLKILAVVNVVNMIVSYTLVFGPGPLPAFGIDGIVTGTVVGRLIGGFIIVRVLIRGRSGLRIRPRDALPGIAAARRILNIGGPAAADGVVMWIGHFIFLMIIANLAPGALGNAYYAAHIVAIRIEAFTYLPAVAYATATATIVGQSLGAGDPGRAYRAGNEAVLQCGLFAVAISAFYYFGADFIFHTMHEDALVREVGPPPMRILALFQIFLTTSIIYVGALRGAGDTRYPLLLTFVSIVFVRLPLGYYCGIVLQQGLLGAWFGMYGDMIARAIFATVRYTRARWIQTRV